MPRVPAGPNTLTETRGAGTRADWFPSDSGRFKSQPGPESPAREGLVHLKCVGPGIPGPLRLTNRAAALSAATPPGVPEMPSGPMLLIQL